MARRHRYRIMPYGSAEMGNAGFIVQRRGLFGWYTYLERQGPTWSIPEVFATADEADLALFEARTSTGRYAPVQAVREFTA